MQIPVSLPGFEGRNLVLETAGLFSGAKLLENGSPVPALKGLMRLRDNAGMVTGIRLKRRFLDAVPDLDVEASSFSWCRPLQWYQCLWMGVPLILLLLGGALGGFCGGVAAAISSRIFRSVSPRSTRLAASYLWPHSSSTPWLRSPLPLPYTSKPRLPSKPQRGTMVFCQPAF